MTKGISDLAKYRKSLQQRPPKNLTSHIENKIDSLTTGVDSKSFLATLILLGVVRASDSHRAERIKGGAKKILDDPRNLAIVEKETENKIPFATDPKEISIRSKRLFIEGVLRLSPSIAEKITSFLPVSNSTKTPTKYSASEIENTVKIDDAQIENVYNKITQLEEFPQIITEAKKYLSATKNPEENQDLLALVDSFEDKLLAPTSSSIRKKLDLPLIEPRKSTLKIRESSATQKSIDLVEFEEYMKTKREEDPQASISLIGTSFENAKLVGKDFCYGFFADLSDSPELKKKFNFLENTYSFGKENILKLIRDVDFSGVDFRSANINIDDVRFENCNFEGAIMPSSKNAEFINSNLRGTDWSNTEQNNLKIGRGNLEYSINEQILILRNYFKTSESDALFNEVHKKIEPFLKDTQIIDASGANFTKCTLISPNFFTTNFRDADFNQSTIKKNLDGVLILKDCDHLNLQSTKYELTEILEKDYAIKKFSGFEEIDFDKLKENCAEIYGQEKADRLFTEFSTDGFVPKELLEKLRDNQKIVVKIHINPDIIDKYLDYFIEQELEDPASLNPLKRPLDQKTRENLSKNVIGYLSKLFGEYNIEFVDQNSQEAIDFNINIGVLSPYENSAGSSFGQIAIGNSSIIIGGDPLTQEFNPNYQTISHELLHGLSAGFTQSGYHAHLLEPSKEVGMSSPFCGALTYEQHVDLVIGDKCYKIKYDEHFSSKGEDYVSPCDYHKNTKFLEFLGRKKVEVPRSNLENLVEEANTNQIFFQQFPEKENKIVIDTSLKNQYDISVVKARDAVKYCVLPSVKFCIENHNINKDEMVVIFKPKTESLEPKIIYLSGGQKEIKIGEEILYSDEKKIFGPLSTVEISQPLTSEFLQKSTPQPNPETTIVPSSQPTSSQTIQEPTSTIVLTPQPTPQQTQEYTQPTSSQTIQEPTKESTSIILLTPQPSASNPDQKTTPKPSQTHEEFKLPTTPADLISKKQFGEIDAQETHNTPPKETHKTQPDSTPISRQENNKEISNLNYLFLIIPVAIVSAFGALILKSRRNEVVDHPLSPETQLTRETARTQRNENPEVEASIAISSPSATRLSIEIRDTTYIV